MASWYLARLQLVGEAQHPLGHILRHLGLHRGIEGLGTKSHRGEHFPKMQLRISDPIYSEI